MIPEASSFKNKNKKVDILVLILYFEGNPCATEDSEAALGTGLCQEKPQPTADSG